MSIVFKDFGTAYLAAPLAVGGLTITVDNALSLPILANGDYFYLVLQKYSDRSYVEIVKVTATAGNTLTILRGQAGTSIRAFAVGDYAELRLTVGGLSEFIAQGIGTKMDKSGGGDFSGIYRFLNPNTPRLDIVRTSDDAAASVALDFSASEGHRAIFGGPSGANVATPSLLLRPNGYGSGVGQVKIDKDGVVDAVALVMRGSAQRTEGGAAVRYDELGKFVPKTRTINDHALSADFSLVASDVGALPISGGALSGALSVTDSLRIYSADGSSNIAIEALAGDSPCLTFKSPSTPATVKGLTFNGSEIVAGQRIAAAAFVSRSPNGQSKIALEALDGKNPVISFKTPSLGGLEGGLTFTGNEIICSQRLAGEMRVAVNAGLRFSERTDLGGVSWGLGMDAATGTLGIHKYVSGVWSAQPFSIDINNVVAATHLTVLNDVYAGGGNGILNANGNVSGTVYGSAGNITSWCTASFAPISDATLKHNIKPATRSALEDVSRIYFVSYDWDGTSPLSMGKKSPKIGITAQQMESIDACYIRDTETFKEDGSVDGSVKSLDLVNLLALALKAIQEQSVQVSSLRAQVARLLG